MSGNCDCDATGQSCNGPQINQTSAQDTSPKVCKRCGSDPFIILDKVHIECRACYLESCNKKLRSTIGKTKLLRNNDPILIAYSGGQSSRALLELIKNSIDSSTSHRQQKFRPSILHIDMETSLTSSHSRQNHERATNLKMKLDNIHQINPDWPIFWSTIETYYSEDPQQSTYSRYFPGQPFEEKSLNDLVRNEGNIAKIASSLKDCDLTIRQYTLQSILNDLLVRVASRINDNLTDKGDRFRYILYGSSATQLSQDLLTNVILGNGDKMRTIVSVSHSYPDQFISVLRPLKDFSKKEVAFYLRATGIEPLCDLGPETLAGRKASIQNLTEAFLSKLYVDYPATYSTLMRTGNKMQG